MEIKMRVERLGRSSNADPATRTFTVRIKLYRMLYKDANTREISNNHQQLLVKPMSWYILHSDKAGQPASTMLVLRRHAIAAPRAGQLKASIVVLSASMHMPALRAATTPQVLEHDYSIDDSRHKVVEAWSHVVL